MYQTHGPDPFIELYCKAAFFYKKNPHLHCQLPLPYTLHINQKNQKDKKKKMVTFFGSDHGGGGGSSGHGGKHLGVEDAPPCCITRMLDQGSTAESRRFYLARKTAWEMLKDRGYNVADSELTRSFNEFRSDFGDNPDLERLRISASLRSNLSKRVNFM